MAQTYDMNLIKLVETFHSEEKCRAYLEKLRWSDGVRCPRCDSGKISQIHDRDQFDCDSCRYQFSVTSKTVLHDTKLPLWKWFLAVYMIVESKKGISANQLKRTLNVSYRTAWYLCHRIRKALEGTDGFLTGVIEIDETWIGGVKKGKGQGHKGNKTELNIDHLVPRSRGGGSTWDNVVVACIPCNRRKGDRMPDEAGMQPRNHPRRPRWHPGLNASTNGDTHPQWQPFLDATSWPASPGR